MIKSRSFAICAGAALLCAAVFGQNMGGGHPSAADMAAHEVERLSSQLSLTTEQQSTATAAFTAQQTTTSNLRTGMETARKALTTAITTGDSAAMQAASSQLGTISAQETLSRATAQAAIYASLTAEQQAKYVKMLAGGPRGGGPGFGGPGGGPGGPPPMN